MPQPAPYKDPTFDAVLRLEIGERQCAVCLRRVELSTGALRCGKGKRFPSCRGERGGFVLDVRGAAGA